MCNIDQSVDYCNLTSADYHAIDTMHKSVEVARGQRCAAEQVPNVVGPFHRSGLQKVLLITIDHCLCSPCPISSIDA